MSLYTEPFMRFARTGRPLLVAPRRGLDETEGHIAERVAKELNGHPDGAIVTSTHAELVEVERGTLEPLSFDDLREASVLAPLGTSVLFGRLSAGFDLVSSAVDVVVGTRPLEHVVVTDECGSHRKFEITWERCAVSHVDVTAAGVLIVQRETSRLLAGSHVTATTEWNGWARHIAPSGKLTWEAGPSLPYEERHFIGQLLDRAETFR